jgi:hypothetical protein
VSSAYVRMDVVGTVVEMVRVPETKTVGNCIVNGRETIVRVSLTVAGSSLMLYT